MTFENDWVGMIATNFPPALQAAFQQKIDAGATKVGSCLTDATP
jgi:hypothetical protein